MPILNWIGKEKIVNHDKELPYRVLKPRKDLSVGEHSENLLIQGDNLEALKSLLPQYQGKIKCIYIDPPYNTGNEGWVYNDKVNSPQIKQWLNKVVGAEGEDLCRHDKWLCMMYPRLKFLHQLLREDGTIFISIDDNEYHNLRQALDEIFREANFVGSIIWKKKTNGNNMGHIPPVHDYIVVYAKNILECSLNELPLGERYLNNKFANPDHDPRGDWTTTDLSANHIGPHYPIKNPITKQIHYPPEGRYWVFSEEEVLKRLQDGRIIFGKTGKTKPVQKKFKSEMSGTQRAESIWDSVALNSDATKELGQILSKKVFENPKPTNLIKQIVRMGTNSDDIILDSFAGSGTTGQAVMELNKEDGGNRKFILVELENNIAESITAQRLKKVSEGYEGALFPEGTLQGFQYLDLNGELFDSNGMINRDAHYEDLAGYIYFSETGKHVSLEAIKSPWIGEFNGVQYFLLFSKPDKNILDEAWLKKYATGEGQKIVYADKSLVDEEVLSEYGVVFKQIPYELRQF